MQLQADLTMYHKAAEFQKYIGSTFSVDGKRNRSAVNHHAFSQHIIARLKGAAGAEEGKAFRHFVKKSGFKQLDVPSARLRNILVVPVKEEEQVSG